jgi:hypothetical protein
METKQTAAEWLEDALSNLNTDICNTKMTFEEYHKIRIEIWVKAKQMEKEQIKDAFDKGYSYYLFNGGGEQYYSVTYGKQDIS